jgi:phosphatidylserine/phosphatidylglycerophosphate/cardiolipin synthase-like enzyme
MKLIVQPDAGVPPILAAIKRAKKSVDIVIFRLDLREVLEALASAVRRGVAVRALIAHTNRGGEKSLRKLELRLLGAGVTVARTADDLARYHGKMMIVDRRMLHLYGFNFTWLDLTRSRSFGVVTRNHRFVGEALKLFDADSTRQPYTAGYDRFVVSPENARERLTAFIAAARHELLIYDPRLGDPAILRLLVERMQSGVDVRIIGKIDTAKVSLPVEPFPGKRLHVRAIVRDGNRAFLGSQSLRRLELERRREIGLIVDDSDVVRGMRHVFEQDWAMTPTAKKNAEHVEGKEEPPAAELVQPAASVTA